MSDFTPQYEPQVRPKDIDAVQKQMLSGWVGPSKTTIEFENELKRYTGAKHCISTTNGTTAIMLAIKSLNLPPKSTILFPAYTFLAGANACRLLGHKIQLVDISRNTLCMNPNLVDTALNAENISCVMFVNHNAYVGSDVQIVKSLCDEHCIPMLEDSSQAIGMPNAGRVGKVGIFSFSVPKLITTGQGGVVITDDDEIATNCMAVRDHGDSWRKTKIHERIGGNFKFNDILAAYGLSQLQDIDELLRQRKEVFDRYRLHINITDYGYDSTWMIIYVSDFADAIITALANASIQAVKYYRPINHNPPYADKMSYSVAESTYNDIIYLPSSLNLTPKLIDTICDIILQTERNK